MLIFANDIRSSPRACLLKNRQLNRNMHQCTDVHTHRVTKHSHLPVQISPPAVHFSLALWSLFMSPCVPPSKPLFLLSLPFCYISCISASLPHFFLCVWFPPFLFPHSVFRVSYQIFHHVTVNKVKCSTPIFLHFFFSPSLLLLHHSGLVFYLLSPARNLTVTPNPFFTSVFLCYISELIEHLWWFLRADLTR